MLVRYKLVDATSKHHEHIVECGAGNNLRLAFVALADSQSTSDEIRDDSSSDITSTAMMCQSRSIVTRIISFFRLLNARPSNDLDDLEKQSGATSNGSGGVEQFERALPMHILSRCYHLSLVMALVGFSLGILGILIFIWSSLPFGISAFATSCLGSCFLSCAIAIITASRG